MIIILKYNFEDSRKQDEMNYDCDLCVVGGGMAGVCCAITAAREGIKVILIQDRPILGGNASSEVRLWVLGATSHGNNNNRWAREGGVVDEILVENMFRNKEGNSILFDTILLEKVIDEKNIKLLLNTAVYGVEKADEYTISSVRAYCSQNETMYNVKARLFCDASGDGVLGYIAGAPFRYGAEEKEEFHEDFAPDKKEYGELLGHTIFFYTKDTGKPVKFIPPSYALKEVKNVIPRYKDFKVEDHGCKFWWIEYGGRLDTIHDTEKIKWELWKVVFGVWDHIKNSGDYDNVENLTIEWVGAIPGKRESRRFEGEYMLTQQDIVEQKQHYDNVSFGGWSVDLHPADGIYSAKKGCNQFHSKGIYPIPYRCLYSKDIKNLFLAGRIISASHVAFGSTRVMATCANSAQAVGIAAALCIEKSLKPKEISDSFNIKELQQRLIKRGQYIPGIRLSDTNNLIEKENLMVSSELKIDSLKRVMNKKLSLYKNIAQMIPLKEGNIPQFTFYYDALDNTELEIEFRISSKSYNHTPDIKIDKYKFQVEKGENKQVIISSKYIMKEAAYGFICFKENSSIMLHATNMCITGMLGLVKQLMQQGEAIGFESFEFWTPLRRPEQFILTFDSVPTLEAFSKDNLINGFQRPISSTNAWVADFDDKSPQIDIKWETMKKLRTIELCFDTDFDHPMESVLRGHPEAEMPYCIKAYRIINCTSGVVIFEEKNNHQARNTIILKESIKTSHLNIEILEVWGNAPAAVFEIRCYE